MLEYNGIPESDFFGQPVIFDPLLLEQVPKHVVVHLGLHLLHVQVGFLHFFQVVRQGDVPDQVYLGGAKVVRAEGLLGLAHSKLR